MKKFFSFLLCGAMLIGFTACEQNNEVNGGDANGHEYVDLGLPSGTLWATCNVGASTPEDYGDYFAWGEIEPKENYSWSTYKYCNGDEHSLTKYCIESNYGIIDNKTILDPEDDAATANWGKTWRMPTHAEQQELIDECEWEWTDNYNGTGVSGRIVTGKNGNSIFLPAAGSRSGISLTGAGLGVLYWSSSLYDTSSYGFDFGFNLDKYRCYHDFRFCGFSIRPVYSLERN